TSKSPLNTSVGPSITISMSCLHFPRWGTPGQNFHARTALPLAHYDAWHIRLVAPHAPHSSLLSRFPVDRPRSAGRRPSRLRRMVNLTRIYTRTGDAGETRLGDMSLTAKTDLRLEAYADVDEANAHIGVAIASGGLEEDVVAVLTRIQNDLFDVGADLCTPVVADPEYPPLRI